MFDLFKIVVDKFELNCSDVNFDSFMVDVYILMCVLVLDKGLKFKFEL